MKKLLIVILIISMFSSTLYGCDKQDQSSPKDDINGQDSELEDQGEGSKESQSTEKIKVFYGDSNNEKMLSEEREIQYKNNEDKYKAALQELIKGPENKKFITNINSNTKVFGTIKQKKDLIVDLSKEFNYFAGSVAEIIGVGSIVNTLTQFKDIERVKILVEGEELIGPSGEPRGFMEAFPLDPQKETSKEIILYFGNKNATAVVGEKRTINLQNYISREDFIKKVIQELIKGPKEENLISTIPQQTKVLSVMIKNSTAYIDFSEEMHTKHWGGAAGESMTINSIVNTLTEFDYIEKVKMTVEDEPLAIEHSILTEPVERDENMIEK